MTTESGRAGQISIYRTGFIVTEEGVVTDAQMHPHCRCPPAEGHVIRRVTPPPPERQTVCYHNSPERTLEVVTLNRSLLFCIAEISRRQGDCLRPYFNDLIGIARDMALTLSHCVEENMGSDDRVPRICNTCRGEIIRG